MTTAAKGLAVSIQTRLARHAKAIGMDPNLVLARSVLSVFSIVFRGHGMLIASC